VDARIEGLEGLAESDLVAELERGGRFVFFEFCISVVIFTLRRPGPITFVRASESGWVRGLPYTFVTLLLGWWGLPWGVIYTPLCLATNLAGGCDVTHDICRALGISAKETP
jgi:hypothetical protein